MFVRMTHIALLPEKVADATQLFNQEIAPVVKQQKGNKDVWLLESTEKAGHFISVTIWQSESDAQEYESSGKYKELVDKVRNFFAQPPELKTYRTK